MRTALVTGAAGGIGSATARRLARDGARVVALDHDVARLSPSPGIYPVEADVTDVTAMEDAVRCAAGDGTLDLCIANAGVVLLEDFVDGIPAGWRAVLEANVVGVMVTLQAAARRMLADGRGGRLLATASVAGLRGEPRSAVYCASKAGVIAIVQSLAVELAGAGITVNAVAPGEIDTPMHAKAMTQLSTSTHVPAAELRANIVADRIPLGRMGTPEDVAGLYAFLASDDAAFITGETFRLDGGQLLI